MAFPTTAEEFLADLTPTFVTFSMDELFDLLSNFNFAAYPTFSGVIWSLLAGDLVSLVILGMWRARRRKQHRKRTNTLSEQERQLAEVRKVQVQELGKKKTRLSTLRLQVIKDGPACLLDLSAAAVKEKAVESAEAVEKRISVVASSVVDRTSSAAVSVADSVRRISDQTRSAEITNTWRAISCRSSRASVSRGSVRTIMEEWRNERGATPGTTPKCPDASANMSMPVNSLLSKALMAAAKETKGSLDLEAERARESLLAWDTERAQRFAGSHRALMLPPGGTVTSSSKTVLGKATIQERIVPRHRPLHTLLDRPDTWPSIPNEAESTRWDSNLPTCQLPWSCTEGPPSSLRPPRQPARSQVSMPPQMAASRVAPTFHPALPSTPSRPFISIQERIAMPSQLRERRFSTLQSRLSHSPLPSRPPPSPPRPSTSVLAAPLRLPPSPPLSPPAVSCAHGRLPHEMPPAARRAAILRQRGAHLPPAKPLAVTIRRDLAETRRQNNEIDGERREAWTPPSSEREFSAAAHTEVDRITYPEPSLDNVVHRLPKCSLATRPKVLPANQTGVSAIDAHELDTTEGLQPGRTRKLSQSSMVLPSMVPPSRVMPNLPAAAPASEDQEAPDSSVVETTSVVQPAERDHSRSSQRLSTRLSAPVNRLSSGARARISEAQARISQGTDALKSARMPTKQELKARWDARPTAQDVKERMVEFFKGVAAGFRSDHTLVSFVAPAEDDAALSAVQVTQLFWTTLMVDLYINCFQYGGISEEDEYQPLTIIPDIINGIIGALFTVSAIMILRAIFRWGNRRKKKQKKRKKVGGWRANLRSNAFQALKDIKSGVGRGWRRATRASEKDLREVSEASEQALGASERLNRWDLIRLPATSTSGISAVPRTTAAPTPAPRRWWKGVTPPPSPPAAELGLTAIPVPSRQASQELSRVDSLRRMVRAQDSALRLPVSIRADRESVPRESQRRSSLRQRVSIRADRESVPGESQRRSSSRVGFAGIVHAVAARDGTTLSTRLSSQSRESRRSYVMETLRQRISERREPTAAEVKREQLNFLSNNVYYTRQAIAWFLNFTAFAVLFTLIIGYAAYFGEDAINDLLLSWAKGIGMAVGILEPINIVLVVAIPMLLNEKSCLYKCYQRIFYVYNEFVA